MASEKTGIHTGHRARMRSRFFETGLDGFQPHEILELLLFCVIPKRDVNPIAHALLDEFGSVDAVLSATPDQLSKVPGVGRQTGEFFAALSALTAAYQANRFSASHNLSTLSSALRYISPASRNSLKYGVTVIYTDRFNRPLSVHSFPGRADDPMVIRAVLSKALGLHSHNAVIFCTGYRSSHPLSRHELASFQPLIKALSGVNAFTVDCILLSRDHLLSLRRENLLTVRATELQDKLSRWDRWLGALASNESENRWYPISLLEDGAAK